MPTDPRRPAPPTSVPIDPTAGIPTTDPPDGGTLASRYGPRQARQLLDRHGRHPRTRTR